MSWLLTIALQPSDGPEELERRLWDLGTTGIAEVDHDGSPSLIAGFDDQATALQAAASLGSRSVVTAVDASSWPSPEPQELIVGGRLLTIEVAKAFGHGHHPTTRLALEAVTRLAGAGTSVLDVGTGTGILALAAAALGSHPVVGVDVDPEAIAVAMRNAGANRLDVIITDHPIDSFDRTFDLVVVNMLAAELAPLADSVVARLSPSGTLVVTGFLGEQLGWVESFFPALEGAGHQDGDDQWGLVTFTPRAADA